MIMRDKVKQLHADIEAGVAALIEGDESETLAQSRRPLPEIQLPQHPALSKGPSVASASRKRQGRFARIPGNLRVRPGDAPPTPSGCRSTLCCEDKELSQ